MNYKQHILKLIRKRDQRIQDFETIIQSHNKLWEENKSLIAENKLLKIQLNNSREELQKIKDLYKIVKPKHINIINTYFNHI
jgi:hypothetical protein